MASRGVFSMLGRKAAAAGAAGASVAANQPSAHAREAVHAAAAPAPVTTRAAPGQVYDDDWTEPHFEGQEVLVFRSFRPDEVDDAFASVQSALEQQQLRGNGAAAAGASKKQLLAVRAPMTIEEDGDRSSTAAPAGSSAAHAAAATAAAVTGPSSPATELSDSSYGEAATDVLGEPLVVASGGANVEGLSSVADTSAAAADMSHTAMRDLLQISRKLLTRPGLQREVFKCMVEDAEVRELMLRQSRNIDLYLQAVGVHTPAGLITDGSAGDASSQSAGLRYRLPASVRARVQGHQGATADAVPEEEDRGEEEGEKDLLGKILDAVASCIDQTGSWLAGLGGWLRGRFLELGTLLGGAFSMGGANPDEGVEEDEEREREGRRRGRSAGDVVLGAAMVVTVAVFCVLLARNPRLVVAAGTAAAGTAAAAKRQQVVGGAGRAAPRA